MGKETAGPRWSAWVRRARRHQSLAVPCPAGLSLFVHLLRVVLAVRLMMLFANGNFVLRRSIQRELVVGQVVGRSALGDVFHKILPPGLWAFPHGRPLSHGSLSYSAGLRPSLASVDRHGPVLPRQMLKVLSFVAGPFRLMVYCLG